MLNSTKIWQERFEQEYWGKFGSTKTINDIKQFISDLIAQTREETIREVENVLYEAMDMGYSKRDIIDKINKLKK